MRVSNLYSIGTCISRCKWIERKFVGAFDDFVKDIVFIPGVGAGGDGVVYFEVKGVSGIGGDEDGGVGVDFLLWAISQ